MSITDDLAAIKADLASGPFCWLVQSHSGKNPPHGWSVRFTDPEQEDAVAVDLHRPDRIRRLVEHVEHERSHVYRLREYLQTVAGYQIEAERLRERNKRQAKRLWYVEHLLRSAYPFVPGDTAWDFNCGGYLQDLIDQALGDDDAK